MSKHSQRQIFLDGEADEWYKRNQQNDRHQRNKWLKQDQLGEILQGLPLPHDESVRAVEVGCGQGLRLQHIGRTMKWKVAGIDPSTQAIQELNREMIECYVGTADSLPIEDSSVDLLIFGFCLYLCDRGDLFSIAAEAHRVLKKNSWLAIIDFWSPHQHVNSYHHKQGIFSYKDDLPSMFTWHPSYVVTDHRLRHHSNHTYTDDAQEWVAATMLRRSD